MCAFLRSAKGSDYLKNKEFMKKTAEQKRQYLGDALRYISDGALDERTIGRILHKVSIHEQYTVAMFSAYPAFQRAVAHAQSEKVRSSAIFSRSSGGAAAVVITPLKSAGEPSGKRLIYIHSPARHRRKGGKYEQTVKRTYSL